MAEKPGMKALGEALRKERDRGQFSDADVASKAGVSASTIWRWETGKTWPKDADRVVELYAELTDARPIDIWKEMLGNLIARGEGRGAQGKGRDPAAKAKEEVRRGLQQGRTAQRERQTKRAS